MFFDSCPMACSLMVAPHQIGGAAKPSEPMDDMVEGPRLDLRNRAGNRQTSFGDGQLVSGRPGPKCKSPEVYLNVDSPSASWDAAVTRGLLSCGPRPRYPKARVHTLGRWEVESRQPETFTLARPAVISVSTKLYIIDPVLVFRSGKSCPPESPGLTHVYRRMNVFHGAPGTGRRSDSRKPSRGNFPGQASLGSPKPGRSSQRACLEWQTS